MPHFPFPASDPAGFRPRPESRHPQAGLTLIEVVGTVAVILILSALAVSKYGDFRKGTKLAGEARNLFSEIGNARSQAMKKGMVYLLRFDAAGRAYSIYGDTNGDGSGGMDELVARKTLDREVAFGIASTAPAQGPGGTGKPADGIEGAWTTAVKLGNDRMATVGAGSVYLSAPGIDRVICIRQPANSNQLEMWRWDGSGWAPM